MKYTTLILILIAALLLINIYYPYNFSDIKIEGTTFYTLNKKTGELYIFNVGSNKIMRLDLTTGVKDIKEIK